MGQIVGTSAKVKRCNLNAIQTNGSQYSTVLADGEYMLVCSDNTMTSDGNGIFDAYVVGDGTKTCGALDIIPITGSISLTREQTLSTQELLTFFGNIGQTVKKYYNAWTNGYNVGTSYAVGGTFSPGNINANSNYGSQGRHTYIEVVEGEKYYVGTLFVGGSNNIHYAVTDKDYTILSMHKRGGGGSIRFSGTIEIPTNGKYLFIQHSTSDGDPIPQIYKVVNINEVDSRTWENIDLPQFAGQSITIPAIGSVCTFSKNGWTGVSYLTEVKAGETYRLTAILDSDICILNNRNVCIYRNNFADIRPAGHRAQEVEFTIPDGSEQLLINVSKQYASTRKLERIATNQYTSIIDDSKDKEKYLVSMAARANTASGSLENLETKRLCFAWITDSHNDVIRYRRFINYVNHYKGYIDAVLHTGDMNKMADNDNGFVNTVLQYTTDIPLMPVLGNHDAHGNVNGDHQALTSGDQLWNGSKYILPFGGENVTMGSDNCYYYRDFTTQKIRVIAINDYDRPRFVEGNGWITTTDAEEIASAVDWTAGTSYAVDDVVLYKGLYLKCTTAGTLVDDGVTWRATRVPLSKYRVDCRHLGQAQVEFIIEAMNVPSGWGIIFTAHEVLESFSASHTLADNKWNARNNLTSNVVGLSFGQNGYIIQDLITAYLGRTTLSKTYKAINPSPTPLTGTLVNNTDIMPDVVVNADFTSAVGDVICMLSGHSHADGCYYSNRIEGFNVVQIVSATSCYISKGLENRFFSGDLLKGGDVSKDCFNLISFDTTEKKIYLTRIGADVNDNFDKRDYTVISYAHT